MGQRIELGALIGPESELVTRLSGETWVRVPLGTKPRDIVVVGGAEYVVVEARNEIHFDPPVTYGIARLAAVAAEPEPGKPWWERL